MIVTCERCQTRFRVPDEKVAGKSVKLHCAKCGHSFRLTADATAQAASAPAAPAATAPLKSTAPPPLPSAKKVELPGPTAPLARPPAAAPARAAPSAVAARPAEAAPSAVRAPQTKTPSRVAPAPAPAAKPAKAPAPVPTPAPARPSPPPSSNPFEKFGTSSIAAQPPAAAEPQRSGLTSVTSAGLDFSTLVDTPPSDAPPQGEQPATDPWDAAQPPSFSELRSAAQPPPRAAPVASGSSAARRAPPPAAPPPPPAPAPAPVPAEAIEGAIEDVLASLPTVEADAHEEAPAPSAAGAIVLPVPTAPPMPVPSAPTSKPGRSRLAVATSVLLSLLLVAAIVVLSVAGLNEGKLTLDALSPARLKDALFARGLVPVDVSIGLYDTAAGRPAFYVRGTVVNQSDEPAVALVQADILEDSRLVRAGRGIAGVVPTVEQLRTMKSSDALEAELKEDTARQTPIAPGASADFVLVFSEYPHDLGSLSFRVTATRAGAR